MDNSVLLERLEMLPEPMKKEAADFIDFLFQKAAREDLLTYGKPAFGTARGQIYMSSDFDEPMKGFKEYM